MFSRRCTASGTSSSASVASTGSSVRSGRTTGPSGQLLGGLLRRASAAPGLRAAGALGHLPTGLAAGVERVIQRLPQLCGPEPWPSLLHGDAQQHNFVSAPAERWSWTRPPTSATPRSTWPSSTSSTRSPPEVFAGTGRSDRSMRTSGSDASCGDSSRTSRSSRSTEDHASPPRSWPASPTPCDDSVAGRGVGHRLTASPSHRRSAADELDQDAGTPTTVRRTCPQRAGR